MHKHFPQVVVMVVVVVKAGQVSDGLMEGRGHVSPHPMPTLRRVR